MKNLTRFLSVKRLRLQIPEENYAMLLDEEKSNKYYLKKMIDWQEDYSHIEWSEFKDRYWRCDNCGSYEDSPCICYAR